MKRQSFSLLTVLFILAVVLLARPSRIAFAQGANGVLELPSVLQGTVDIFGVATHETFRKWQLDILIDGNEGQASFIAVGDKPLGEVAKMASLNTTQYPNGQHKLRLRVAYTGLQYDEFYASVIIANGTANIAPEDMAEVAEADLIAEEERGDKVEPTVLYNPDDYATTLSVGSGYKPTQSISRNAKRSEIEAAQNIDLVTLKTDVTPGPRRIEIDLSEQKLIAYEGDTPVMITQVSTGKINGTEKLMYYTETVTGSYKIQRRYEAARMSGPGYDTHNVPYIQYFFRGYAIHGAYWHNEFGMPVSHGCINMRVEEAKQLFVWADIGTEIIVSE